MNELGTADLATAAGNPTVMPLEGSLTPPLQAVAPLVTGDLLSVQLHKAVADLMSAVDMLPPEKKASFLKARQRCPALVELETTPALFLQHDNYNYWKAAERLAGHWAEREKIFGERAFLPMTQTGHGALTKEDVVTLHTGSHARLAPTRTGQPVVFTDRRRILSSSHRQSRARCFWYVCHKMTQEPHAATQGILFLVLLVTPRPTDVDFTYMQKGVDIMNLMPANFHLYLLNCVSKTGKWTVTQKLIQSVVSFCLKEFGGLNVFTETDQDKLKEKVVGLGCVPEGLPSSVGGSWKYEEFTKWCRGKVNEEIFFEDSHLPKETAAAVAAAAAATGTSMSAEHKKARTKNLNVIHSRQKRERRKAEQAKMEQDCRRLQSQRWELQQENARLEGLLMQARKLAEQLESNSRFMVPMNFPGAFQQVPMITGMPQHPGFPMQGMPAQSNLTHSGTLPNMYMNALAAQQGMSMSGSQSQSTVMTMNPMGTNNLAQMANPSSHSAEFANAQLQGTNNSSFLSDASFCPQPLQPTVANPAMLPVRPAQGSNLAFFSQQSVASGQPLNMNNNTGLVPPLPSQNRAGSSNMLVASNNDALGLSSFAPFQNQPAGNGVFDDAPLPLNVPLEHDATLRDSVPQEFVGLEIPDPDPLPESLMGASSYPTGGGTTTNQPYRSNM